MRINWKNIYGILGIIFAIWLFRNFNSVAESWLENMPHTHRYLDKHPALPFMALALVCVTTVAILKYVQNAKDDFRNFQKDGMVQPQRDQKGFFIMNNQTQYPVRRVNSLDSEIIRRMAQTAPRNDDVEVIDLDDPRANVKPTTWHT